VKGIFAIFNTMALGISITISASAAAPPVTGAAKINCSFPGHNGNVISDDCAEPARGGTMKMRANMLKYVEFDNKGLASGTFGSQNCYWMDKKGNSLKTFCLEIGPDYYSEGFVRYLDSAGHFGFMDDKMNIKIPPKYDFATPFKSGLAKVCSGCKPVKMAKPEQTVYQDGKWFVINKLGKQVANCPGATNAESCKPSKIGKKKKG
jgi:hypothetical protein